MFTRPGALSPQELFMREAQLDDEYFHADAARLPLPDRNVSKESFDMTPASAFAMSWNMFRSGVRTILP